MTLSEKTVAARRELVLSTIRDSGVAGICVAQIAENIGATPDWVRKALAGGEINGHKVELYQVGLHRYYRLHSAYNRNASDLRDRILAAIRRQPRAPAQIALHLMEDETKVLRNLRHLEHCNAVTRNGKQWFIKERERQPRDSGEEYFWNGSMTEPLVLSKIWTTPTRPGAMDAFALKSVGMDAKA